jgi:DNA-binding CsgD family transcriptional regulator
MVFLGQYKNLFHNKRVLSVISFSLLFGYVLSFVFEGQVLYQIMEFFQIKAIPFIFSAIFATLIGLLASGVCFSPFFGAKRTMLGGIFAAAAATLPFFFPLPPIVWLISLFISAFGCGVATAAWGYYLKTCTPRNERYKTCADVLIYSNIIMIINNGLAIYIHPMVGLWMSLFLILSAGYFTHLLPRDEKQPMELQGAVRIPLTKPILSLMVFVVALTINSGLMYQVFNPAYRDLEWLTGWYWAVPYVIALAVMRRLLQKTNRPYFLYIGMVMIMMSFIFFMLTTHNAPSYLLVNTLMLGACGIFDLFWWGIFGEILEYSRNIVRTAGICISSNVLGVLIGGILGNAISFGGVQDAHVAVLALAIVCITTAILPLLNIFLVQLLKSNVYLYAYSAMPQEKRSLVVAGIPVLAPLSAREKEVLQLILAAQTNKAIAETLHISEYTVKTHVKNIFGKYDVTSRAELITFVLKNQSDSHV